MIYLLISIVLNAYLGVAFSIFNRYQVDLFQTIVFNYWTCVITGCFFLGEFPVQANTIHESWFLLAMFMGILFISVFNLIAQSSIKMGVTITQTANKLSFCIPVMVALLAYREEVTVMKILGIFMALIAVILTTKKTVDSSHENIQHNNRDYFLPLILFLGSGLIDTITKFAQRNYLKDAYISNAYLISGFMGAASIGSVVLIIQYVTGKRDFKWRNVVAGIVLGFPNYFSIYYLVKALSHPALNSSATLPINNIGILFLVSLFGIFILKEKLSRLNYIGLALTLLAILLIYIGDKHVE